MATTASATTEARRLVRRLMPVEADLAFRRRCETIVEFLGANEQACILDCGCGYGFVLRVLVEATGARIVGLDPDQERLDVIRERLGPAPSVSYVQGDAQALPFGDAEFSHIVCSEVLEHLDDDCAAASELIRVLRPGGIAAITVPSSAYPFAWDPANYLMERLTGKHFGGERPWSGIWYGHQRLYRSSDLRNLLERAGFEIVEERPLTHYCPPFAHLVLYGLLKPLLMAGVVPASVRTAGDRFQAGSATPGRALGLGMKALELIDRPNDSPDIGERKRTFVALSVKARRPA